MAKIYFLVIVLLGQELASYTPPADFIFASIAQQNIVGNASFNGIKVSLSQSFSVTLALKNDGLFIVEELPIRAGNAQGKKESAIKKEERVPLHFVSLLIGTKASETASAMKNYLVTRGVDLNKITHGLFNNEPILIIGAEPNDHLSPQLWVDKNGFLPVKEITSGQEIRFEKWAVINALSGKKFPSLVSIISSKNDLEKLSLSEKY